MLLSLPVETPASNIIVAGLGLLSYLVLLFAVGIAFRVNRPEPRRPSTAVWKTEPNRSPLGPELRVPQPRQVSPLARALVAFLGAALLTSGSMMPSSQLVQSAALTSAPWGSVIYILLAMTAVVLAAYRLYRPLYLVGGVAIVLLLTTGIEGTIMMEKYAKPAQEYAGQLYGIGFSWIVMLAGAALLVLSAALHPTAKQFPTPPPVKTRRDL